MLFSNMPKIMDMSNFTITKRDGSKAVFSLDKIMNADQGQFSIEDRDSNTPYIKKVRVVTTVTYSLKD